MADVDVFENEGHNDTIEAAEKQASRHSRTPSGQQAEGKPYLTGMCVRDAVIVETIRRETRTKEYFKDGRLMFASKPTVNEESQGDKESSYSVSAISAAKFQMAKAESVADTPSIEEEKTTADAKKNGHEQMKSSVAPYVFAKYSDNVYYLAQVLPKSDYRSGTVTVKFSDSKDELKVKEASLLQPKEWLQKDRTILVREKRRDDVEMDFEEAVIKRVVREEGRPPRYAVRLVSEGEDTKATREVALSEIGITEDEVSKYQNRNSEVKTETRKAKTEDRRGTETPPSDRGTGKNTNGARGGSRKNVASTTASHKKSKASKPSRETRSPSAVSSGVQDDRKPLRIGKLVYYKGEHVFSKWDTDDRWYAGTIQGVERSRFLVKWGETGAVDKAVPDLIVRAKDVLVKGASIHIFSEGKQFYDDGFVESYSEKGLHLCSDKRGVVKAMPFENMMMEDFDVKSAKKLARDLVSPKDSKALSAAKDSSTAPTTSKSSDRESTAEKAPTSQPRSTKRARSATPEDVSPSKPAPKSAKREADAEPSLPEQADSGRPPLHNCTFIVTNGSSDPTFVRDELVKMIDGLGGAVLQEFHSLAECGGNKFLVAPSFCRTAKYLQCLAADFPCVSHKWILATHEAQETGGKAPSFEKYRLPAGRSTGDDGKIIKWKPRKILLDNLRVGLVGQPPFLRIWCATFQAGKAADPVVLEGNMLEGGDLPSLECILSETSEVSNLLQRAARSKHIPVVTVEWIIQTLIHGEKQAFEDFLCEELE